MNLDITVKINYIENLNSIIEEVELLQDTHSDINITHLDVEVNQTGYIQLNQIRERVEK